MQRDFSKMSIETNEDKITNIFFNIGSYQEVIVAVTTTYTVKCTCIVFDRKSILNADGKSISTENK